MGSNSGLSTARCGALGSRAVHSTVYTPRRDVLLATVLGVIRTNLTPSTTERRGTTYSVPYRPIYQQTAREISFLAMYPSPPSRLQLADSQNLYGRGFASRRLSTVTGTLTPGTEGVSSDLNSRISADSVSATLRPPSRVSLYPLSESIV